MFWSKSDQGRTEAPGPLREIIGKSKEHHSFLAVAVWNCNADQALHSGRPMFGKDLRKSIQIPCKNKRFQQNQFRSKSDQSQTEAPGVLRGIEHRQRNNKQTRKPFRESMQNLVKQMFPARAVLQWIRLEPNRGSWIHSRNQTPASQQQWICSKTLVKPYLSRCLKDNPQYLGFL